MRNAGWAGGVVSREPAAGPSYSGIKETLSVGRQEQAWWSDRARVSGSEGYEVEYFAHNTASAHNRLVI